MPPASGMPGNEASVFTAAIKTAHNKVETVLKQMQIV